VSNVGLAISGIGSRATNSTSVQSSSSSMETSLPAVLSRIAQPPFLNTPRSRNILASSAQLKTGRASPRSPGGRWAPPSGLVFLEQPVRGGEVRRSCRPALQHLCLPFSETTAPRGSRLLQYSSRRIVISINKHLNTPPLPRKVRKGVTEQRCTEVCSGRVLGFALLVLILRRNRVALEESKFSAGSG